MTRASWARRWVDRDAWAHKIYLLCQGDPQKILWARDNLSLPLLAEFYKDYLAASDASLDEI